MKHTMLILLVIASLFLPSYAMEIQKLLKDKEFSVGEYDKNQNQGFICLWEDCRRIAFTREDIDWHVRKDHLSPCYITKQFACKWQYCRALFCNSQQLACHMPHHIIKNVTELKIIDLLAVNNFAMQQQNLNFNMQSPEIPTNSQ